MLDRPTVNLLLLPCAGSGSRMYRSWKQELPPWISPLAIDLPGHDPRDRDPPLHDWPLLTERVYATAASYMDRPFAVFGHSMGALVGLALIAMARERLAREPLVFFASACQAPSLRIRDEHWLNASRDCIVAELRALGGTSSELLASSDFVDMVLPMFRADFHLCGTFSPSQQPGSMPLIAVGGTCDSLSAIPENLLAWSAVTTGAFRCEMIEGDHFFIETARSHVLHTLVSALDVAARAT